MERFERNCVFCRELSGSKDTNFHRIYPNEQSRIIAETASLLAFPCIGQLQPHHYLIVTRQHYPTFAKAQEFIEDLPDQIADLLSKTSNTLSLERNTNFYFEHGATSPIDGGCGIYHAHIHVVPNAGHISLKVGKTEDLQKSSDRLEDIFSKHLDSSKPYVMHGSDASGYTLSPQKKSLPSQTLRRLAANELGISRWNWRDYSDRDDTLIHTLKALVK